MRVAVDWRALSADADLGRAQHQIHEVLQADPSVEIWLFFQEPLPPENAVFENVRLVPVSVAGKTLDSVGFDVVLAYSQRLQTLLKRYKIDVFHNTVPFLYPFYSAITVCPVVSNFLDAAPLKAPDAYFATPQSRTDYLRCLNNVIASQVVIAASEEAASDLRLYTGYPRENIVFSAAEAYQRAARHRGPKRRRIAVWSSTPPSDCGVADYNAELIGELAKAADVDVYVNEKFPPSPAPVPNIRFRDPRDFGIDGEPDWKLFQLGAREFQWYMYPWIRSVGGTMVLHDISMGLGFYWHARHYAKDLPAFEDEVVWPEGESARQDYGRLQATADPPPDMLEEVFVRHKMLRWLIRRSDRLLVHTEPLREQLRAEYPEACVAVVRMGVTDRLPAQRHVPRAAYRCALGLSESDPLVGVFGMMESNKRLDVVIRAFGDLLETHPNALLMFVGRCYRAEFGRQIREWIEAAGAAARVVRLDYTPHEVFHALMGLSDVVVNLRTPIRGGLSAVLVRALAAGRATIISEVPEWSTFSSEVCLRVRAGDGEAETLAGHLRALADDRELRGRYQRAARRWFLENGSAAVMARDYLAQLKEIQACPATTK